MKKYNAYKPSGIEWVGDIPEKWSIKKLKYIFRIYAGATPKTENVCFWDGNVVWVTPADYKTDDKIIMNGSRNITEDGLNSCNTRIVPKGSLIFSKRAPIGTVAISGVDLCTNQGCLSCVPQNVNSTFFYYLISVFTEVFDMLGSGATFREISADAFANVKVPVPPLSEQIAIAAYLDAKCAKVDNVISVQQKRIEFLKELKQSVITHAVTKGLDKNVELKPSGIDWIGDIPKSWNVKRMRFLCKMNTGDKDTVDRVDDGLYPFYVRSPKIEKINSYTFDGEAVLMAGDGVGAGKVIHYANGKFDYHQRVYNFHEYREVLTKYAYYYLVSNFRYKIEEGGAKNTVDSVRLPWLKDFPICIPTILEQEKILSYIERKSETIDNQISKIERQIELLKEYKQSIITECVTGKRKVC